MLRAFMLGIAVKSCAIAMMIYLDRKIFIGAQLTIAAIALIIALFSADKEKS